MRDLDRVSLVKLAGVIAVLATVSSCAQEEAFSPYPNVSLGQTKEQVQLLRNEAADRVPQEVIAEIASVVDESFPCLGVGEDPQGLIRSWQSTVDLTLVRDDHVDAKVLADTLIATFVDQGWSTMSSVILTSDTALVTMRVLPVEIESRDTSQLRIEAIGPCVVTGGMESEEVSSLHVPAS